VQPTTAPTAEATIQPTAAPTVDPALAAEILSAYEHYWQVRDDAFANLDDSQLSGVMDGVELVAAQTYIEQLRSQGRAAVGPEDHSITILSASPEEAVIHDDVVDRSIFVDPTTKQPLPPDQQAATPAPLISGDYYMRKLDGVWKVVREG
jgi:hypothetical protein